MTAEERLAQIISKGTDTINTIGITDSISEETLSKICKEYAVVFAIEQLNNIQVLPTRERMIEEIGLQIAELKSSISKNDHVGSPVSPEKDSSGSE